jgi:hypothetical protein
MASDSRYPAPTAVLPLAAAVADRGCLMTESGNDPSLGSDRHDNHCLAQVQVFCKS